MQTVAFIIIITNTLLLLLFTNITTMAITMKAAEIQEYGEPENLKIFDVEIPTPQENQVLVKVMAAGVNPYEAYIRSGVYAMKPPLPWRPGNDGAGIIEKLGKGAESKFKVGDRVWVGGTVTGTYAEFCVASIDNTHELPDSISFGQGASLFVPARTAYRGLFTRVSTKAGDTVLVHGGSGAVGVLAVQLAVANGCKVVATAGTEKGIELLESLGAIGINHKKENYQDDLKQHGPYNIILEMLANVNLNTDIDVLARRGYIVVIGNRGTIDGVNMRKLMQCEGNIVGLMRGEPWEDKAAIAGINGALFSGVLKPIVSLDTYSLSDAAKAQRDVIEKKNGSYGKIVLTINANNDTTTKTDL